MTSRQLALRSGRCFLSAFLFVSVVVLAACASSKGPAGPADRFPLDPREELSEPFPDAVRKGWEALSAGRADAALREFAEARSSGAALAADIGWIEALIVSGRSSEALSACGKVMPRGEPTLPLLVACAEARARSDEAPEAYDLYRVALARPGGRPGLRARTEELRLAAGQGRLSRARKWLQERKWDLARAEIDRAISAVPESPALRAAAGDIEAGAGNHAAALARYREALDRNPKDPAVLEKAGELAVEQGDHALAVEAYEELARRDARFANRAAEARLVFRVANWPVPERQAALSEHLTRAGAAELVWWMFPEVREARVSTKIVASDAVSRRDSRAVTRAVALNLLEVDRDTHRARPDAPLTVSAASRLLMQLVRVVRPTAGRPCAEPSPGGSAADAVQWAIGCGLMKEQQAPFVDGPTFTRALDKMRLLVSAVRTAAP